MINRHPHRNEFYLVNDRHDIHDSIKNSEHFQRAGNVFPKRNIPFPAANQVGSFFANPANIVGSFQRDL